MAWTDGDIDPPRTREEILADVRRRGGRIRRRRRTATGLACALALVVPIAAVVSLAGGSDRGVNVTAAGSTASTVPQVAGLPAGAPGVVDPSDAAPTTVFPGGSETAGPPTTVVPGRRAAASNVDEPAPTTQPPPADDPVVRLPPATASVGSPTTVAAGSSCCSSAPANAGARIAGGAGQAASAAPPGNADSSVPACPAAGVAVTVMTDKAVYGPGEAVRGTSTLENRSDTTCLVSGRAFFHIVDAAGRTVGDFAHTTDYQLPVKAEPGKTFTGSFTWDQRDCSSSPCLQVTAGTYTAIADWTEAGPYSGRGSFRIGG